MRISENLNKSKNEREKHEVDYISMHPFRDLVMLMGAYFQPSIFYGQPLELVEGVLN